MGPLLEKLRRSFIGREPLVFVALLLIVLGIYAVVRLFAEIREG